MGSVTSHPHHLPAQPFNVPVVFSPARQARYAYRIVSVAHEPAVRLDETQLNALGKDGWLLVSVVTRSEAEGRQVFDYLFVRTEP